MKPKLVIGLGNPLMGDEGVGWHVIERLAGDARLPRDTDLLWGSTDLLGCAGQMEGRRLIVLVDAWLCPEAPGSIAVLGDGEEIAALEDRQEHVHQLSVVQALRLLKACSPPLSAARFTLIAVAIASARVSSELSPAVSASLPQTLERVLAELA